MAPLVNGSRPGRPSAAPPSVFGGEVETVVTSSAREEYDPPPGKGDVVLRVSGSRSRRPSAAQSTVNGGVVTPWYGTYCALPCDPRPPASCPCGWSPVRGGTLHQRGGGPCNPPGMGGVAPLVERFQATPPLRGLNGTLLCTV